MVKKTSDWIGEIPAYGICADMAGGIGKYVMQEKEKEEKAKSENCSPKARNTDRCSSQSQT